MAVELGPKGKIGLEEAGAADESKAKLKLTLIFPNIHEESHYYRDKIGYGRPQA